MPNISVHCTTIPDDVNKLMELAVKTAKKIMNLAEDSLGPIMQLISLDTGHIQCSTTTDASVVSAAIYAPDETFLFDFILVYDFDIGWQVKTTEGEMVEDCKSGIMHWLEVQE